MTTVPAGSDLPKAIGLPATRALTGAGLTTLDRIATRTADELLAIHGVGPKAVRILAGALAERGSGLRDGSGS
jgi:predicted flap endonuclease-1-like 5' DNA nuclease